MNKKRKLFLENKKYKKFNIIKRNQFLSNFKNNIHIYSDYIWTPNFNCPLNNIITESSFDFLRYRNKENKQSILTEHILNPIGNDKNDENDIFRKAIKIKIFPTKKQKNMLMIWFDAYIEMYNETLKFLKNEYHIKRYNKSHFVSSNWKKIRNLMYQTKRNIMIKRIIISNDISYKVYSHTLDNAVKLVCSHYKTCFKNYNNGRMKKPFNIKYWKYNRSSKIMDFEHTCFKLSFCKKIFGNFKIENTHRNNKQFELKDIHNIYKTDVKLHYNQKNNEFNFIIPERINHINIIDIEEEKLNNNKKIYTINKEEKRKNVISIDLGVRTFINRISDNEVIKIGTKMGDVIEKYLKRIDRTNKSYKEKKISKKKKTKITDLCERKIKQKVTDMHWKCIDYLNKTKLNRDEELKLI